MIARVHIELPYALQVPDGASFVLPIREYNGLRYRIGVLAKSEMVDNKAILTGATIDGKPCFNADIVTIDFFKKEFQRKCKENLDPSIEVIRFVLNDFLTRLRYVIKAPFLKPSTFPDCNWKMRYLNDDGIQLKKEDGQFTEYGLSPYQTSWMTVTPEIWDDVEAICSSDEIPGWRLLLLDAKSILPDIGPAITLAFTALEVYITKTLEAASRLDSKDSQLWKWLDSRHYVKDTTIQERFDFGLGYFLGIDLKESSDLWNAFIDLKKARNRFTHDGVLKIGTRKLLIEDATRLVHRAEEIIEFIESKLPEELQSKTYKYDFSMQIVRRIGKIRENIDDENSDTRK